MEERHHHQQIIQSDDERFRFTSLLVVMVMVHWTIPSTTGTTCSAIVRVGATGPENPAQIYAAPVDDNGPLALDQGIHSQAFDESGVVKEKVEVTIDLPKITFDRDLVGVAFSPYWGTFPQSPTEYPMDEIKAILRVVHQRFRHISTYSMGTMNTESNWNEGVANCRIAQAAAELNRDEGTKFLVNIGVYQHPTNLAVQAKEIRNAIEGAKSANQVWPGTVWGITFTNEYFYNMAQAKEVLHMIHSNKKEVNQMAIAVGTRSQFCYEIYAGGQLQGVFQQMARELDFIYCNVYVQGNPDVATGAAELGQSITKLRSAFHSASNRDPPIDFRVGETGWASKGITWQQTPNNVSNMVGYWKCISEYAVAHNVQIQMFAAIDEKWKGVNPNVEIEGETHYGWWKKNSSDPNDHIYVEKVEEVQDLRTLPRCHDPFCCDAGPLAAVTAILWPVVVIRFLLQVYPGF